MQQNNCNGAVHLHSVYITYDLHIFSPTEPIDKLEDKKQRPKTRTNKMSRFYYKYSEI